MHDALEKKVAISNDRSLGHAFEKKKTLICLLILLHRPIYRPWWKDKINLKNKNKLKL